MEARKEREKKLVEDLSKAFTNLNKMNHQGLNVDIDSTHLIDLKRAIDRITFKVNS